MISDRRDDPEEGLLLYLKQPDMKAIPVKAENKQGGIFTFQALVDYICSLMFET